MRTLGLIQQLDDQMQRDNERVLESLNFDFRRCIVSTYFTAGNGGSYELVRVIPQEILERAFLDFLHYALDVYNRVTDINDKAFIGGGYDVAVCTLISYAVSDMHVEHDSRDRWIIERCIKSTLRRYYEQTGTNTDVSIGTSSVYYFFGHRVTPETFTKTRIKFLQSILKCYE